MSLAARTREAVREQPFLLEALRASVVNYTALARYLDVGETEAVAAALRRFADDLDDRPDCGNAQVRMERGVGRVDPNADDSSGAILAVGDAGFHPDSGALTAILATGDPRPGALARALARCEARDIEVHAAGVADELVVVVDGRDGPNALRAVEGVFES